MESGKVRASELLHRRNTVEEFYSPAVRRIKLLTSRCHYPLKPVAQFAHVRGGKRLPPATPYVENHDGSGIPYIRTCDIRPESGEIDLSNVVYVDEATHQVIHNYQLQQNDIVISIAGTIGAVGMLREPLERCNFNENMAKVRVFDAELLPEYVAAYFDSGFGQAYIHWLKGGAVQSKLSLERIEKILVPVPPLKIQHQIIEIMQEAYKKRTHILAQLPTLSIIGDETLSLFGIRLNVEASPNRFVLKRSQFTSSRDDFGYYAPEVIQLISFLQSKAETYLLGDCLRTIYRYPTFYGLEYLTEGVPVVKGETIVDGELTNDGETDYISVDDAARFPKTILEEGDLVMSVRGTVGKVAVVPFEFAGSIINANLIRMQPNRNVNPYYLQVYLSSSIGQMLIERQTTKAIQSTITVPYIEAIPVWLPDENTQRSIAQAMQEAYKKRKQLLTAANDVVDNSKPEVERLLLGENFDQDE